MNKTLFIYIAIAIFAAFPTIAVNAAPSTGDTVTSAGPVVAPSTGDTVTSAGPVVAPSTGDTVTSAGPAVPSTGDSVTSAGPVISQTTPSGSTGGSSSGSSGYGGGRVINFTNPSCVFASSMLKFGADNNSADVTKLQTFLKNFEKLDVNINGIFDERTEAAVKLFQTKYAGEILAPWGATKASGVVYMTTMKKIAQLSCNVPLTLNPAELSIINSYRNNLSDAGVNVTTEVGTDSTSDKNENGTLEVGKNTEDQADNTASVAKSSIFQRFWSFLVGLFR